MGTTYLSLQEKVDMLGEITGQNRNGWRRGEYSARPEMYKPFGTGPICSLEQLAFYYDVHPWRAPARYRERFDPYWRECDQR